MNLSSRSFERPAPSRAERRNQSNHLWSINHFKHNTWTLTTHSYFLPTNTWVLNSQCQTKVPEEGRKGRYLLLLTSFEIWKELETTLNQPLSLFLLLVFSPRCLQAPLFLSRPSSGVLELSDLSKMFTSPALPLVPFNSLLPNKSWQRCVGIYSDSTLPIIWHLLHLKKICLQEPNFTGGRKFLLQG